MGKKVLINGEEVELHDDVVNEIQSEGIKRYQEENPDPTPTLKSALDEVQAERDELRDRLEQQEREREEQDDADNDDISKNISGLRKKLEDKDKALKDLESKINNTNNFVTGSALEKAIAKHADGDEEMEKKIRHHYENTLGAVEAISEKDLFSKVEKAAILSGWSKPSSDALSGSASRTSGSSTPPTGTLSASAKSVASALGITDEDLKNHGKV